VNLERAKYVMCKTLLIMEDLKDRGLVAGGPKVDRQKVEATIRCYEFSGAEPPTTEETLSCVNYMKAGGQYEDDIVEITAHEWN